MLSNKMLKDDILKSSMELLVLWVLTPKPLVIQSRPIVIASLSTCSLLAESKMQSVMRAHSARFFLKAVRTVAATLCFVVTVFSVFTQPLYSGSGPGV